MIKSTPSLLEQLNKVVDIDVDTLDREFIGALPITPHDMTCNPRWLHDTIVSEDAQDIVNEVVSSLKGKKWDEIYCHIAARIQARCLPLLSGRVLAQVSPTHADDVEYMVWQGRTYNLAWKAAGVPTTCVKVPLTSAGVAAAKILKDDGIDTLGTCLFNIYQAVAASQVGQYAVSMYLNEPRAWLDAEAWDDVEIPASQHPMGARHARIRVMYDQLAETTGKKQPHTKTASLLSARECLAMYDLGADHVTLNKGALSDLLVSGEVPNYRKGEWKVPVSEQMALPGFNWETWDVIPIEAVRKARIELVKVDPLTKRDTENWLAEATKIDYLQPGVLDKINEEDPVTKSRLEFSLGFFATQEAKSRAFIEEKIASAQ